MNIFSMILLVWVGMVSAQPVVSDRAKYDAAVAKARIDRDMLVRNDCMRRTTVKEKQDCVKRVDAYVAEAVKGFKKQYNVK